MSQVIRFALVVIVVLASHARAETPNEAAANALFEEGQKLVASGKIDEACTKFEESLRLDAQVGTKLNLADCRERQNRLVEAYELYEQARSEAAVTNKPGRADYARTRLENLAKRLARLTVKVGDASATVRLVAGGASRELPRDRSTVIAPGTIAIEATAPGHAPFRVERSVRGGEAVVIDVPALTPVIVVGSPQQPTQEAKPATYRLPWVVGGTGAVLLVGSIGLGLHAKVRYDDAVKIRDESAVDSAQREADIATGLAIVGSAAIVVGIVLYLKRPHSRVAIAPTTDGSRGIVFVGRY